MNEFIDALLIYWTGFSSISQNVIGQLGYTIFGRELSSTATHWIFYGVLTAIMIFLIRARQAKIRNELETRRRYDI